MLFSNVHTTAESGGGGGAGYSFTENQSNKITENLPSSFRVAG